jgi:hypothetical protein
MKMRVVKIQNAIAASILAVGTFMVPVLSQAREVTVVVAPPAPIVETVPGPRAGYVWAPGYYRWSGNRHVWVRGYWVRERPHHHWVAHNWEQRGDRWAFRAGHWDRD